MTEELDEKIPILIQSKDHDEIEDNLRLEVAKEVDVKKTDAPTRRVEVDLIIIFLTYGILLFHVCLVYTPNCDWLNLCFLDLGEVTLAEDPYTTVSLGAIREWFVWFMHVWIMPMFFYLSGKNTYSALKRRTETQFRDERVHRLLVPVLFMSAVTQFPITLSYFAPHVAPLEHSFGEHVRSSYQFLGMHQCWFLVYLFIYAQIFTFWFRASHPNHNDSETDALSCCGSTEFCFTRKPFGCMTKFFCCLGFWFKPASTPEEFISSVKWYLGGPVKLAIIPGLLLGILETANNLVPWPSKPFNFSTFPFFSYMAIYILGYAVKAADKHIQPIIDIWPWTYFTIGTGLCTGYGLLIPAINQPEAFYFLNPYLRSAINGFVRGFGQWLFLIGVIGVMGQNFTETRKWHKTLREMAMPFYVIHLQVLVALASGALWVPYLRTFPAMLLISSLLTGSFSYLISEKFGALRYFFGLTPPKGSCLPGEKLRGFVPTLVLSGLVLLHIVLANVL